jgi:hypothetical protein
MLSLPIRIYSGFGSSGLMAPLNWTSTPL